MKAMLLGVFPGEEELGDYRMLRIAPGDVIDIELRQGWGSYF